MIQCILVLNARRHRSGEITLSPACARMASQSVCSTPEGIGAASHPASVRLRPWRFSDRVLNARRHRSGEITSSRQDLVTSPPPDSAQRPKASERRDHGPGRATADETVGARVLNARRHRSGEISKIAPHRMNARSDIVLNARRHRSGEIGLPRRWRFRKRATFVLNAQRHRSGEIAGALDVVPRPSRQ